MYSYRNGQITFLVDVITKQLSVNQFVKTNNQIVRLACDLIHVIVSVLHKELCVIPPLTWKKRLNFRCKRKFSAYQAPCSNVFQIKIND